MELVKLLVNIEETAQEVRNSDIFKAKNARKLVNLPKSLIKTQSFPSKKLTELKEKQQRRFLRSKVTKILNGLPCKCKRNGQKEEALKWAEQKQKLYELNSILESKGFEPVNKLNISRESERKFQKNQVSARSALTNGLTEAEIQIISDDPAYFLQDKGLLKLNFQNNWDKMLANDPKNPENKKKQVKTKTEIDFLLEEEPVLPRSQVRSKRIFYKTPEKPSIFQSPFKNSKKHQTEPFLKPAKALENKPQLTTPRTSHFPSLKLPKDLKEPLKKREQSTKHLQEFIRTSITLENMYKNNLIKSAKDSKLHKVKYLLSNWEHKRKPSMILHTST